MPKFTSLKKRFPHKYYPFSDPILKFMEAEPSFYNSLKLANWRRFKVIPHIKLSHTPPGHPLNNDQIIGVWYFDTKGTGSANDPYFKQDFIVNTNSQNLEFHSYTVGFPRSQFVHNINDFFRDYGQGQTYYHRGSRWEHHYPNIQDLPGTELRDWGSAIFGQIQTIGRCAINQLL